MFTRISSKCLFFFLAESSSHQRSLWRLCSFLVEFTRNSIFLPFGVSWRPERNMRRQLLSALAQWIRASDSGFFLFFSLFLKSPTCRFSNICTLLKLQAVGVASNNSFYVMAGSTSHPGKKGSFLSSVTRNLVTVMEVGSAVHRNSIEYGRPIYTSIF